MKKFPKLILLISILLITFYLFSCGCGKIAEKAAEEATRKALEQAQKEIEKQNIQPLPEPGKEKETSSQTTKPGGFGAMDDNKFVDILSFQLIKAKELTDGKITPEKYMKEMESQYSKNKVKEQEYLNYLNHLVETDLNRYVDLVKKAEKKAGIN
ncbi:MAG TPA: hypothetical protein ENN58_00250 [bacterium]|nr:hypothetical protein [bacterium]